MRLHPLLLVVPLAIFAQDPVKQEALKEQTPAQSETKAREFVVEPGTKIPLGLINSVSTKTAAPGDKIYLETMFPIIVDSKMVIPPGSYVSGTVTHVKRPGKVKGRAEFHVRFDSLTLPNGVTRDFRASIAGLDGRAAEDLDRKEGTIKGEGNKTGDLTTIGEVAMTGTGIGALAGAVNGRAGMGAGIGAAAGATAALVGVLLSRGPEAVLAKGTGIEMILDRPVKFDEGELDFRGFMSGSRGFSDGAGPQSQKKQANIPGRRVGGIWY